MKRDRIVLFIALLATFGFCIAAAFAALIIAEPLY
jgi:hypothetical protein